MENVSIIALISAASAVFGIIFGYLGYQKGLKKDSTENGKNSGVLMSDVGYIKAGIDDLKRKQEKAEARHYDLADRVTKVEVKVDQLSSQLGKGAD